MPEAVEDEQRGADGDSAVGNVESRIVPMLPVEKQKVHDAPERETIPEITEGATEDERESRAVPTIAASSEQPDDENRGGDRDSGNEIARPVACIAQETECGTGVESEHEAEERRQDP